MDVDDAGGKGPRYSMEVRMAYYMFKDRDNLWRWHLLAGNNRKIANSGEGYYNSQDCRAAIQLVKGSSQVPVYEQ